MMRVLSTMPFSAEFVSFIKTEAPFWKSLKLANPERFSALTTMIVSQLPSGHPLERNQVFGLTYLDKDNWQKGQRPFFKQDFVVRLADDGTFVSYTAPGVAKAARSPYVRSLDDFEREYGDGGLFYTRRGDLKPLVHHLDDIDDLPLEQQEEAARLKEEALTAG